MDDPRPIGERAESAEFAPVRVGAGRGRRGPWAPLLAAGWIAVIAGVVTLGTIGRSEPGPVAVPSNQPAAVGPIIRFGVNPRYQSPGPSRSSDPNPVQLAVTSLPAGVSVSGTILTRSVVWVFVSVQDASGRVQAWRSLSVEDPDGGIRPSLQPAFTVQLDLPVPTASTGSTGLLWVEVNAYNAIGRKVGSVRQLFGPGTQHDSIRIKTSLVR